MLFCGKLTGLTNRFDMDAEARRKEGFKTFSTHDRPQGQRETLMLTLHDGQLEVRGEREDAPQMSLFAGNITEAMGFSLPTPWPHTYREALGWWKTTSPKRQALPDWQMVLQAPTETSRSGSLQIIRKGRPLEYLKLEQLEDDSWKLRLSVQTGMLTEKKDVASLITHLLWALLTQPEPETTVPR